MKSIGLDKESKKLRKVIIEMLSYSRRGHLGSAFSILEILRVLYGGIMRYKANNPKWSGRDRFILSKGNGCLALYAVLADRGFFPKKHLNTFCRIDSILGGHPEDVIPGVEVSTGSLGHGLSVGLGMALNAKMEGKNYRVFVIIGDGESNEGSIWEAALSAAKNKLDNLVVITDYNKMQSYGSTRDVLDLEPLVKKWQAFGFETREVDGHNVAALKKILKILPVNKGKPTSIICHTVKGKGVAFAENNPNWHHQRGITDEVIEKLYKALEDYPNL